MGQQLALPTLDELEIQIERGLETFVEVGLALMEVRDRRLYREAGYMTFENYCIGRWDFKRHRAYQLMEAAQTVQALSSGSDDVDHGQQIPESIHVNERQARELAPLAKTDPQAAREIWQDIQAEHGASVTATKVREAVQKRTRMKSTPPEYPCETCGEIHDRPVWHCDGCDEHYTRNQRYCPDCNPPAPRPPNEPLSQDLELLRDARYTLEEARDLVGADTSPGGAINGLIRNLDNVVKDIRRWRGELV